MCGAGLNPNVCRGIPKLPLESHYGGVQIKIAFIGDAYIGPNSIAVLEVRVRRESSGSLSTLRVAHPRRRRRSADSLGDDMCATGATQNAPL